MKVVILAGGLGTRISEESQFKPKPMVEIAGKPILWHIMKLYSHYGYNDFVICAGYKQDVIKQYFFNYYLHNSDVSFDLRTNKMKVHSNHSEPWNVAVIDTGLDTMTGGRIKRIKDYVNNEPFMLTYGDGVADVDIKALLEFHKKHGKIATMTAIRPSGRFGILDIEQGNAITSFREKSQEDMGLINGGFMVLEPGIFDFIEGDNTVLEREPLEKLARQRELMAFKHDGFWQCMDTLRDKKLLDELLAEDKAPWKVWED